MKNYLKVGNKIATTKIWSIKKRLDHVIQYATNPSKTSAENYKDLHNVIEYTKASYKTEEQLYVTSINCSKEHTYEDMMRTKRRFDKMGGIIGFHAFQSFAKGEVTPELAHKIGVELANELWGDRFEVVVTTHLNTNCIHNHFCLNSVSFKDGKKFYDTLESYALMRETSDRLCEEYKLSVIKEKVCAKSKIDYEKFYKNKVVKEDYYIHIKDDIDYAIEQADDIKEFNSIMKKFGYEINNRYGKLSVKPKNRKRPVRIERTFGEDYKIENINKRINEVKSIKDPFPEARTLNGKYRSKVKLKNKKVKGIVALYFHYCYLLKIYPRSNRKVMSKELKEEIKKLERISKEAIFLNEKDIKTSEKLSNYKDNIVYKINILKGKKENLYKRKNRSKQSKEKEQFQNEIDIINIEIKELKEEMIMIEEIEERMPKIKENVQEILNNKQREKVRQEKEIEERRNSRI